MKEPRWWYCPECGAKDVVYAEENASLLLVTAKVDKSHAAHMRGCSGSDIRIVPVAFIITEIRKRLEPFPDGARKAIIGSLGYCLECGRDDPEQRCQCWNDP